MNTTSVSERLAVIEQRRERENEIRRALLPLFLKAKHVHKLIDDWSPAINITYRLDTSDQWPTDHDLPVIIDQIVGMLAYKGVTPLEVATVRTLGEGQVVFQIVVRYT